jgi:hypothetical protein
MIVKVRQREYEVVAPEKKAVSEQKIGVDVRRPGGDGCARRLGRPSAKFISAGRAYFFSVVHTDVWLVGRIGTRTVGVAALF